MGHREWFDLGKECEILSRNLIFAMQKADGEVKLRLSEELQKLSNLVESVECDEIEEDEIENALAVWNSIYANYEKFTLMKVEKKEEVVVSSSVNTLPRSKGAEEEK